MQKEKQEIINQVHDFVSERCIGFSEDNIFKNHILNVRNYAIYLAKEYNANIFVVAVSAYLHDISYIMTKDHSTHEIEGSKFAKKYLSKFNISKDEITLISKCILNHRGSKKTIKSTVEEEIIACSDAMDHIMRFEHMFYRKSRKIDDFDEVIYWLNKKLERGYKKITLKKGKDIVREKYLACKIFLNKK
jgi:putative nucleotidyltransferase with HDIG domain